MIPNVSTRRDIEVPWSCKRDGKCCEITAEVRVTHLEREAIERAAPTSASVLAWRSDPDPRFVRLIAKPCPLYVDGACSVYDVRPAVCRSFMCGRVDTSAEPYEAEPVNFVLGLTGCGNLSARLKESERFRQHYATNARKVQQTWGSQMGWSTR